MYLRHAESDSEVREKRQRDEMPLENKVMPSCRYNTCSGAVADRALLDRFTSVLHGDIFTNLGRIDFLE